MHGTSILSLLVASIVASSFATVVKLCDDPGTANLNFMNVEGCEDGVEGRCQFVKGNTYSILVNSETNENSNATALLYSGKVMILEGPVTLFEGNACEFMNIGDCPTSAGEIVEFEKALNITNTYPVLQAQLIVEVQDENKKRLNCALINFSIVNA